MNSSEIKRKKIVLFGSTGSVGRNTLDVVAEFPERFEIVGLAAHSNTDLLIQQIRRFQPQFIEIGRAHV